jgi:tRNA pseudouridine38-40 synthase
VEYDGRRYYGFQWQTGLPTIQSELELAVHKLTGEKCRVTAASRTDTAVHAKGQMVSFRTASSLSPQTVLRALNYYLPVDIAVRAACIARASFNVRSDAVSREYEYRILNSTIRSPLAEGFTYLVAGKLNIRIMNKACQVLKGKHDFASFASALYSLKNTVRTVYEAKFVRKNTLVTFHMVANSFLPHQVRNTVGLLIRVGLGKVGLEEFKEIMGAKKVGLAGPAAPPYGLYLTKVNYPADLELKYENLCN